MKFLPNRTWIPLLISLAFLGIFVAVKISQPSSEAVVPDKRAGTQDLSKKDTTPVVQKPGQAAAKASEALQDIDVRAGRQPAVMFDGEGRGVDRLRQEIPGVVVDFDPVTKSPKWIGSNSRLLTGPQAELAARDKDAPITQFIDAHRELFGHGAEALSQARRVTDYSTPRSNSRKVVWHQQHEGIDIFEAVLQANLASDSALINIGSQFMASPQAAKATLPPALAVGVEQAVAAAGRNVGENIQAESVHAMGPPADQPDKRQQFRAALLTDADARLTWVPLDTDTLRLAWDVTLTSRSRAEMYRVLVDTGTGDVLARHAMTAYISDATYRVYTTESPTPFSPGHQSPSSLQPLPVSRVLVTTPALNTTASPAGWINDGGNTTSGNNADAYTDVDNNNVADLPRTTGSPNRVFDFPHDLTQDPANLKDASVTQLFYWTNFMHDRMYELGFTEAAGNFQTDNFGRGGLGNDPVNSEAQDGSGTNNANFSTPVDGGRGRMQMFNWTGPTPDRDGSFEAEVVLHEYGHGVSNRLVGGPSVTISSLATRGMGEGWSDFYGLALTAEASDNPHGNWARAGWSRYLTSSWLSENYYYGARRYSYSTDMTKNPHTFRDIDPDLVDWHTSVPRNPTYAATQDASQVHYVGTIWATTLWDIRANLILKHGFATGNERTLFLVTEGMKLGPANPNFIQARDGILQAALVNHPADLGEVWTAFAKRGMGDGATAPVSTTTTGITEQYDVPDGLEISDRSGWNISGSAAGGFLPATKALTLSNDSAATVNWTAAPNAVWLSISPASGSLSPGANVSVTVTTQAGAMPAGFHSTNIVFTNSGSGFRQPVGVRLTVTPPAAQTFDLSTSPGWTTTGQWAYGTPAGSGGTTGGGAGNPDPSAGATGSNVYGVNLAGNPSTTVGGPFYLTTSPVNLSARQATRLRFKRWLNSNTLTNTRMTVQISTNGTDWRDLFVNSGTAITDNAWQTLEYDISSIADLQPAVQVRWGYQNLVSTTAYSGWNIDDIEFLGDSSAQFSLNVAASVSEGAASLTGTLNLNLPQPGPITVTLESSNPAAATVQPTVTLAAGEVTKTFTITPVNDTALDGVETTQITATAAGIAAGGHLLTVTDDETAILSLSAPGSVNEGTTGHSANLTVSMPPTKAVTVQISASSSRLSVPASVTIPAGSTGPVPFTFDAADNQLAEGTQNTTITATVTGWTDGTAVVGVTDNDTAAIALTGPAAVSEGSAPVSYTVTVNTVQAADRVVNVSSTDSGELTVPTTVTIPAGQFSTTFNATVVNDTDFDGAQPVVITASVAGYTAGVLNVVVMDNEVSTYTLAAIPSPQRRNVAFPVAITVRDINGDPITSHTGSVTLTSASPGGTVPFTTSGGSVFSQGTATIQVTVTTVATAMTLTAQDAGGKTGTSNSFDVNPVTHAGFNFTTPTSTNADTLFGTTATAVDDLGTTYTGYADSTVLDVLGSYFNKTVGSTTTTASTAVIHNSAAHDSRAQIIYTAAEVGATPQLLTNLIVSKITTGGQSLLNYTVRLKHTTLENFDGQSWEESGWTTVYTAASFTAAGTSHVFTKPFVYDGVSNLMIDISFDNTSASTASTLRQTPATGNRVLYGSSNSAHGSPLTWTAATGPAPTVSNELPTMSFYIGRSMGPLPASPAAFVSGTWSGQAQMPVSGYLRATAPSGVWGTSNYVIALAPTSPVSTETLFSDGFETGTLGTAWSLADNSGATARTQVTTANTPKTGTYHLTMDTTSTATGTYATNRPTLTLNLAGKKNVWLEWYQKGFLDDGFVPTLTGPLGTFASTSNYDGVAISQDGVTWVQAAGLIGLPSTYSTTITRVALDPIIQRLGWSYNSTFRVRFSQYDDQAIPDDGIALDDIAVRTNPVASIGLSLPATIAEGTLNVPVTVTLPAAAASNTSVALTSNIPGRLSVVSPVVITAGQTTGSTTISAPQNSFAEVGRGAVITASASGQTTSYHHVRVVDDEQPVLTMTLPASVTEGGSSASGTVSVEPAQTQATTIFLTSSATGDATVSSSVTLSAGSNSATFTVSPVNDTRVDGTQVVTITASGQGLVGTNGTVNVMDNESPNITVTPPPTLVEGGIPRVGSVGLAGSRAVATVISLVSSDVTEATVPASVTIPAGQISVNFQATPVEDSLQDGQQTVSITASSPGLVDGTASFNVLDNDPASFEWTVVPSPQTRNVPFNVTLTAKDEAENTVTGFNGTVALTAQAGAGALPVTPATTAAFVNGVWTGNVTVGGTGTGVTLLATGSDGAAGGSDAFDVVSGGAAVALAFDAVPQPQAAGAPIPVRVRAVDANGVLVNEVSGPVAVSLITSPGGTVVSSASLTLVNGSATTTFVIPAPLSAVRLQGAAGALAGQGTVFAITAPSLISYPAPELVFEDGFETGSLKPEWMITGTGTHRTQISTANGPRAGTAHLVMDSTTDISLSRNEATLTLNLAGKADVALSFWMKESGDEDHGPPTAPFTTGANFDGVAISADGVSWYEVQGLRTTDGITSTYKQFTINLSTAAAARGLTLNSAFKIRFNHYDDYTYGTDGFAFDDIRVEANGFAPPEPVVTLFADDFEAGVLKPQWAITGTNNHRTEITSQQTPRGSYHMVMDVHTTGDSRNEATLTLDTSAHRDVVLKFWMKENSDEDQAPASNPFTGGADFDGVAVSVNGTTWYEVQPLRGTASTNTYQEFTVDLDTALNNWGLTHGPNLKIRFNHFDNSSWVNGDGFAFDDITITGRPSETVTLEAPAVVAEGAQVTARARLAVARADDTVVTLTTNRPGSLTVPASVTIPAGSLVSADFTIAAAQNVQLTGSQQAQIVASANDLRRGAAAIEIQDDEAAPGFDLVMPGSLAEGSSINGSVSIGNASLFDLPVGLSAAPGLGLTLPATVTIPAGATTVAVAMAKPENQTVLEPASTLVTATLGINSDAAVVALGDNDTAAPLVITLPASVSEGSGPVAGSVGFAPPILCGRDLVINLSSSDAGALGVPATVTLLAGSGSVSFNATPQDNALADGTRAVTVTASAAGVTGDTHDISVQDDELHHFTVDPIASPQAAPQPFAVTIRARSVDDQVLTGFTGTAALSTSSGGSPVAFTPSATGNFVNGVWTGQITFPSAATGIVLNATGPGGATGSSNAFNVVAAASLAITPLSLNATLTAGEPGTSTAITLSNSGGQTANWTAAVSYQTATGQRTLAAVLDKINTQYASITSQIPNRYDFSDGVTGTSIGDGGGDMFDSGNFLSTNLTTNSLSYSDNVIVANAGLGSGGQYFTRKQPGLFVFAADVAGLSHFEITGGLGADGGGSTNTTVLTATRSGMVFKGYVKRVYGSGDPSVNHLIIIQDNGAATHTAATNTDDDQHRLSGLTGVTRLYYLLYATSDGSQVTDSQTQAIMDKFLDQVTGQEWITLSSAAGSVPAGGNASIQATLNPTGLPEGAHAATVRFTSNDPASPQQDIPVTLNVAPAVASFQWNTIPTPQSVNVPFAATLTAKTAGGSTASTFNGVANITAQGPSTATTSGTGSGVNAYPYHTGFLQNRLQTIFMPAEVGVARQIQSIALELSGAPGALANFTIRAKHTSKADYSGTGNAVWDSAGWTTVYSGTYNSTATGFVTLPLTTPFDYDGTSNLMLDISFNNVNYPTGGSSRTTTVASQRTLFRGQDSGNGPPTTWVGAIPAPSTASWTPNVRFTGRVPLPSTPTSVTLANGVWSGNIAVEGTHSQASLLAKSATRPEVTGESNTFATTALGTLSISAPPGGSEGGTLNATVTASVAPAADVTISLSSNNAAAATVPATVTLLAGQTSAAFTISLTDDALLDGTQSALVSAKAPAYSTGSTAINVHDNETTTITLTVPAFISEGGSATTGTVTLGAAPTADVSLTLVSSDTSEITVPANVVIPAGSTSATFAITPVNDSVLDFNQTVTVTASMPGWTSGVRSIEVGDNEPATLSLSFTASVTESQGTLTATLSAGAVVESATTINLVSEDSTEATVPATVTLAAGSASTTFPITVIDDTDKDGSQTFAITASALGFSPSPRSLTVTDNDVHNFLVSAVGATRFRNATFNVTFTARDVNNATITSYSGAPVLAANDGATALAITPTTVTGFSGGVKTQGVSIGTYATNAVITITDTAAGATGASNAFAVTHTTLNTFAFDTVASPQNQGVPFSTTITAQDTYGNTVSTFSGTATLSIPSMVSVGSAGLTSSVPLNSAWQDQRSQIIYTAAELGGARSITSLSLNAASLSSQVLNGFTIRMKHTSKTDFTSGGATWESTGWTTCYQATQASPPGGWSAFTFTTPFAYDGVQNVMIDISFNNSSSSSFTTVWATASATNQTMYAWNNSTNGDPLTWSSTTPTPTPTTTRPDIRLGYAGTVTPSPTTTGAFTAGVWTGPVTVPTATANIHLQATNGSATGLSNRFSVSGPLTLSVTLPATAAESAGTVSGTVSISSAQGSALSVNLASSDTTEAQPAATPITIPAGITSVPFTLNVINDTLKDGTQSAVITASAAGAIDGTATISVTDDDVHNFLVSAIGAQIRNTPFNVTFTARDVNNAVISGYAGTPVLTAGSGGSPVAVSPGTLSGFSAGAKTQAVTVGDLAPAVVLTLTDPVTGGSGSSSAFAVSFGVVSRFAWSTIPQPQVAGVPFPATLTAQDSAGNTVSSYTGTAALRAPIGSAQRTIGTGGETSSAIPFNTIFSRCRSQQVLLASEVGAAGTFSALSINITSVPAAQTLTDFTIRIKNTSRTSYGGTTDLIWETTGFTTVYQGTPTISATGYVTFTFTTPFVYDGVSNLMMDYSYRAVTSTSTRPTVAATSRSARTINYYTSTTTYGEPLTWAGLSPPAFLDGRTVDIRLDTQTFHSLTPATTAAFTNGTWTGNLTLGAAATSVNVVASDASLTGTSNNFEVVSMALALNAEPLFTGGLTNALICNQPAAGLEYEVERSTTPDFAAPVSNGFASTPNNIFTNLVDGQTYHYRARMRRTGAAGWTSGWSPVRSSTQDATPPVLTIPELTTSGASATLAGTTTDATSGVSTVTVGGSAASTANSFTSWTRGLTGLTDGTNSFTVAASDNAAPANTTSVTAMVYRIASPTGDANNNGISALLEHALGIPGAAANPRSMLPAATTQTDGGTGEKFLTLQYRRRLQRTGLSYTVETSTNLTTWDNTGASVQEISAVPTGDGVTETVTVRVTPGMSTAGKKFVRLSVTTN